MEDNDALFQGSVEGLGELWRMGDGNMLSKTEVLLLEVRDGLQSRPELLVEMRSQNKALRQGWESWCIGNWGGTFYQKPESLALFFIPLTVF